MAYIRNETRTEQGEPRDRPFSQVGRQRAFAKGLPVPFGRRQAKPFFEHGMEQAEVAVAAVVGDVDDFGMGIRQQLACALQAQFDLPRVKRHAEFLAEQAAEMPFAAMQLPGQFRQRMFGQFGFSHLPDQFTDMIAEFIAVGGGGGRRRQPAGHGIGPELQQRTPLGQPVAVLVVGQPHKFLTDRLARRKNGNERCRILRGDLQLLPFGHGEHAVEVLQVDGKKLQFEGTKLAGPDDSIDITRGDQTITRRQLPGFGAGLQPIAHALRHAHHQPILAKRQPFGGRRQRQLLQNEVSLDKHLLEG